MDVASAIPVEALDLQPHHSVLDLCCAPGTKLLMLCERATRVVGVDVSPSRLDICRNLLVKRSKVTEAAQPMMAATSTPELYLADGRHFHPEAVSKATLNRLQAYERKESLLCFEFEDYRAVRRKLLNIRRKKSTLPDPRTEDVELSPCHPVFDRVLVDTECTHDGSFRHLEKAAHRDRFLDKKRLDELRPLQLALLARGYKLCKKGGLVVYSTCSLSPLQNETLVNAFLENTPSATLEPLETSAPHRDLGGMVLLDPVTSQTSVQFVAKIRKG
ncbi:MAG: uncharacterized protein KVP18_001808 [Porospora cf. gigantea A]|uniref:uncharacterized protein n=1 Tax=Porospora cf. gigantea A TaxID=2853593 RepID=UPI0035595EA8|nr:MAG: hypothetical protein KVP18_001808 [Porospora cf. gigantea A]